MKCHRVYFFTIHNMQIYIYIDRYRYIHINIHTNFMKSMQNSSSQKITAMFKTWFLNWTPTSAETSFPGATTTTTTTTWKNALPKPTTPEGLTWYSYVCAPNEPKSWAKKNKSMPYQAQSMPPLPPLRLDPLPKKKSVPLATCVNVFTRKWFGDQTWNKLAAFHRNPAWWQVRDPEISWLTAKSAIINR